MKIQVIVKNISATADNQTTVKATVAPGDKVSNVMEFVASTANIVAFPDQKMCFQGKELALAKTLSEYGIEDNSVLELAFQASEQTLVKQLSELLGETSMSQQELSFMYSYRYGMSLDDAFKILGMSKEQIRSFFENSKELTLQNGNAKVAGAQKVTPTADSPQVEQPPAFVKINVSIKLEGSGTTKGSMLDDEEDDMLVRLDTRQTVAQAKEIIAAIAQTSFPDRDLWKGDQKLEDCHTLAEAGVQDESSLVMSVYASDSALASQLEALLSERDALSPNELGLHFCQRHGVPVSQALRTLGLHSNLRRFLESQSIFAIKGGCVTLVHGRPLLTPLGALPEEGCVGDT